MSGGADNVPGGDQALALQDVPASENALGDLDKIAPGIALSPASLGSVPTKIELIRLTYPNSHGLLNREDSDWKPTRSLITKVDNDPRKTGSPVFAISITKGSVLELVAAFQMDAEGRGSMARITGTLNSQLKDSRGLGFESVDDSGNAGWVNISGGKQFSVKMACRDSRGNSVPLSDKLSVLSDVEIVWKVELLDPDLGPPSLKYDAGTSHVKIFLTLGTPVDPAFRDEDGITTTRMDGAIRLLSGVDTTSPHTTCAALLTKLGRVNLVPDPALADVNHPKYNKPGIGGAWPLADNVSSHAECQAMVRLMRAVLLQVGAVTDARMLEVVVISADPATPDKALEESDSSGKLVDQIGGLHGKTRTTKIKGVNVTQQAILTNRAVGVGEEIPEDTVFNFFEAALKVKDGAQTKYYAGGISTPFTSASAILNIFSALVWVHDTGKLAPSGARLMRIDEIIKQYK